MIPPARTVLTMLGIILVSVPLSIAVTILSFPIWSWFEASTGIESVGHSGPTGWCYLVTFLIAFAITALVSFRSRRGDVGTK